MKTSSVVPFPLDEERNGSTSSSPVIEVRVNNLVNQYTDLRQFGTAAAPYNSSKNTTASTTTTNTTDTTDNNTASMSVTNNSNTAVAVNIGGQPRRASAGGGGGGGEGGGLLAPPVPFPPPPGGSQGAQVEQYGLPLYQNISAPNSQRASAHGGEELQNLLRQVVEPQVEGRNQVPPAQVQAPARAPAAVSNNANDNHDPDCEFYAAGPFRHHPRTGCVFFWIVMGIGILLSLILIPGRRIDECLNNRWIV